MIARILTTPIQTPAGQIPTAKARRVDRDVLAAVLPGPGRDRLAAGEVLAVTTGQQPGLFTGPLYTVYKALSAMAWARKLEQERGVPVVPVFWVAGDDHDFAEANHAQVLGRDGEVVNIVLRERPHDAPQLPLFREPCGSCRSSRLGIQTGRARMARVRLYARRESRRRRCTGAAPPPRGPRPRGVSRARSRSQTSGRANAPARTRRSPRGWSFPGARRGTIGPGPVASGWSRLRHAP